VPAGRLPPPVEATAYFFCTEALTNVVRHAGASSAWVRVALAGDRCLIEVGDDGIGGAAARSQVSGLTGLRDRVGALHGTMETLSPAGGGTVLRANLPLGSGPAGPVGVLLSRELGAADPRRGGRGPALRP
jgi:signal transduction histidine kinase